MSFELTFGDYLLQFPVGFLCKTASHRDGQLQAEVTFDTDGGEWCLPVFTEHDLADRFLRDTGCNFAPTIIWFDKPSEFARWLKDELAGGNEYDCIVPDPNGKRGRLIPVAEILFKLTGERDQTDRTGL